MKKPKIVRLRLLAALWPGKRRRGVAIITVLAIVSLMTVLIVSFFQMAQTAKTTAVNSVEMERVVTLKDVITNYVTAQIRTATTLPGPNNSPTIWTSQPGAIRTFHSFNASYNRLYKLYSSEKMLIDNIGTEKTGTVLNAIENDLESQWDQYPDVWVDLNKPVRPSSSERESTSAAKIKNRLIYPIADPSRYNGQKNDTTKNTEGFVYGEKNLSSKTINGVDKDKGQLAMPVRWIYLLRNGTPGVVDKQGKFQPLEKDGGTPTRENPIVSRLAWWVDDESCKINVNTASLPIPWDTPRTASAEDLWYAQHQPVSGECQHYPSHPSQTDVTAVFFPGYRYTPDSSVMPVGAMNPLPDNYAKIIWNITPYITENGGTNGGKTVVKPLSAKPVETDDEDHLFATFEELYFKARRAEKNLDRARESVARDDASGELLSRIETSQFFLTTRSNSPEMTVYSTPRVCMFPMNARVVAEVGKEKGAVDPAVGAFEVTMATNSTVGAALGKQGKPFYFQRTDSSSSRHNAFYNNSGGFDTSRNARIFKYLKKLSVSVPPGYPEIAGTPFNTFGKKYPGPNGINGNVALPTKQTANFDSSDRTQILISMLDLMRSSNMNPGYLEAGKAYDNGGGQVAGICGCNKIKPSDVQAGHTAALAINPSTPTVYTPKGSGRTYGAAEIMMCANVIATKSEGQPATGTVIMPQNPTMANRWNQAKKASLVQVAVLTNAFSPRQGWAPLFARTGINLSNETGNGGSDPRTVTNATLPSPFYFAGNNPESPLYYGINVNSESQPPTGGDPPVTLPAGFVPWAGVAGLRVANNRQFSGITTDAYSSVAYFDTFVYEGPGAGGQGTIPVQLKWTPGKILRVFIYDEDGGNDHIASNFNTIQALEIDLGAQTVEMQANYTGQNIEKIMTDNRVTPTAQFPPPKIAFTSFVVPHGDYRLVSTPLQVERGIFVPHGTNAHSLVEPVQIGNSVRYVKCNGSVLSPPNEQLLSDGKKIQAMDEAYAPHFAPVNEEWLCREDLGTKPTDNVIQAASSRGNPKFKLRFAHGRRDGQYKGPQYKPYAQQNSIPNRGSSDPLETGDFDTGVGLCPDGAYMNQPDDGDARDPNNPYYASLGKLAKVNPATFSPNRVLRSAVDFGSIPSGLQARVPWQTLRFRPDPKMYDGQNIMLQVGAAAPKPSGYQHYFPFSNYCGPKDHLFLDMWWMPVVEPWAISEGFATKGQINLNQQIYPFTYIQRTTALHALLRGERMMAIPDSAANKYKNGSSFPNSDVYRHWINAKETLRQLTEFRWKGQDGEGMTIPFNAFRSASEICELWLVPEKNGTGDEMSGDWNLEVMTNGQNSFWEQHRLTGDNMRERPYANLYPRVTVRSNVFRVHMVAQTLKQASTNKVEIFRSSMEDGGDPDLITAEWRGSALVERVLNPNEPELQTFDYAPADTEDVYDGMNVTWPAKLDNFYTYRVTEVKQFTE